ncbi:tail assembly protein I [Escherichia coli]|uniref:Tail assembly protein I n=1 Tax=Escherichia coli TaxID=562 RepID=A0A376U7V6_ECOLX|nr:tail assembly protein I [Escherichia coli]
MILGGVAQMLAPKAKTPDYRATDVSDSPEPY